MKRRTTSAAAVRAAARAGMELENLELRRLLSSGYQLASTLTDTDHGQAYANFGRAIAVQGNLALIGSPGEAGSTGDGETIPYTPFDTTAGKVSLIDTSTGQVLHSFQNPISNPETNSSFGTSVAFVDGKIAISAPGSNAVYVYDNYNDDLPEHTYTDGTDSFTLYGTSIAADGNDLLVSAPQGIDNDNTPTGLDGIVYRYDLSSGSGTPVGTYFNPANNGVNNDQFGYDLASDGTNIYASSIINGTGEIVSIDNAGNLVNVFQGEPSDSEFGITMATYQDPSAGRTIIISSPEDNSAVQYDAAGNLVRTFNMPHADNVPFQPIAQSLAVSGDKLIAGNPSAFEPDGVDGDGNPIIYPFGEAYVFDIPTGNVDATISNPDRSDIQNQELDDQQDAFGFLVAGLPNGNFVVTSPWNNNQNGIDAGSAFVYEPATAANQPPTANAGAAQTINQGQTATLDASGSTDPDGVGDIVSYSWDLNNDGTYGDATGVTTTFTPANAGVYTIGLQVTDSAGNQSTATTSITVNAVNHAPTNLAITGNNAVVAQQSDAFSGSFTDQDASDTHTVSWNFGDGNIIAAHSTDDAGALTPSHVYTSTGNYTVTMTVADNAGASASTTFAVNVGATALEGTTLYVGGTSGDDVINVTRATDGNIKVNVNATGKEIFTASNIIIYGGDGNDDISVGTGITLPSDQYGGNGNDSLLGGGGNDYMDGGAGDDSIKARGGNDMALGGAGNDVMSGGEGRDFLIGGTGGDDVSGNADDDLLVAGTTAFDNNRAALTAIQTEWLSGNTYTQRIANITNGTGTASRANGNFFLQADTTVFDDAARDTLTGGAGSDWFVANTNGSSVLDVLNSQKGETSTDV